MMHQCLSWFSESTRLVEDQSVRKDDEDDEGLFNMLKTSSKVRDNI